MEKAKIELCSDVEVFNRLLINKRRSAGAMDIQAMYNSYIDRILIGDAASLFTIPIDDHIVVRGHAVFDTATIVNGSLYRHRVHIDRFFESAEKAGLNFDFLMKTDDMKDNIEKQKNRVVEIEKQLAIAAGVKNGEIRLWLSAGPGNLGVTKKGCETTLYAICFYQNHFGREGNAKENVGSGLVNNLRGITECTVSPKYPVKNKVLATMKSNNYLVNALGSTEATEHGGNFGIWVDPVTDEVYEASVCNVIFVLKNGTMITPPFRDGKILKGCTVRRMVELATEHLLNNNDGTESSLKRIITEEIVYRKNLMEVGISEMFLTSGDIYLDSVTRWDDLVLSEDGTPGPVFRKLAQLLYDEAMQGNSSYHEKIEYNPMDF